MSGELTGQEPKRLYATGQEMREFLADLIEQPPGTTVDAPWPLDSVGLQRLRQFCSNFGQALGFLVNVTSGDGIKATFRGPRENPVPMPVGLRKSPVGTSGIVKKLSKLKVGDSVLIDPMTDRGRPMKRGQTWVSESSFRAQVWGLQKALDRTFTVAKIEEGAYVVRRLEDGARHLRAERRPAPAVTQAGYVNRAVARLRQIANDVATGMSEEGRTTLRARFSKAEITAITRGAWARLRRDGITQADVEIAVEQVDDEAVALIVRRAPPPQAYY